MAYDEQGRYYFDPAIDAEDQELVHEAHKKKLAEDYVKEQHKIAKRQHEFNTLWAEVLQEEGLDQQS